MTGYMGPRGFSFTFWQDKGYPMDNLDLHDILFHPVDLLFWILYYTFDLSFHIFLVKLSLTALRIKNPATQMRCS